MEYVKRGLRNGNIGVKFYPPMGYKPDDDYDSIKELFEYCNSEIPILTHCTPEGFEAVEGLGICSIQNIGEYFANE